MRPEISCLGSLRALVGRIRKFADDTKVGHGVSTPEEAGVLQECLDNLVKWAED
jgi:hypothetical protein